MFRKLTLAAAAVAVLQLAGPALAQKANDTLRISVYQPIQGIDPLFNPHPEGDLLSNVVLDTLVMYDPEARAFKPQLAESWRQIDDRTLEFKLRRNVRWHDGKPFGADDVVYTFAVAIDPEHNFRFKDTRFGWIERVEKVDDHTVRLVAKAVTGPALARVVSQPSIYPAHIYRGLATKTDFGRNPVGTGPYRVVELDASRGRLVYERNDAYAGYGMSQPAGKVRRIEVTSVPDQQTQLAQLVSGAQDLIFNADWDLAQAVSGNPDFRVTVRPTVSFAYIAFDAADRSGLGHFKDRRVRQALLHAIDRRALFKAFVPDPLQGEAMQQSMCHPWLIACDSAAEPPAHDLAAARRLMAEAGLADGFTLEISSWGQARRVAEAVAGQLARINVRATVDATTVGVFIKKRAEGKVQTMVTLWDNAVGQPDVDNTAGFFFLPGSRDLWNDALLHGTVDAGRAALDLDMRKAIYRRAFDHVTEQGYMMPLVPLPAIVLHRNEVAVQAGHLNPAGITFNRIGWR